MGKMYLHLKLTVPKTETIKWTTVCKQSCAPEFTSVRIGTFIPRYCPLQNPTARLDFRLSLLSGLPALWVRGSSAGSFPEQRLVIEPRILPVFRNTTWIRHSILNTPGNIMHVLRPHSPSPLLHSHQTFRSNMVRRWRWQNIRLFCSQAPCRKTRFEHLTCLYVILQVLVIHSVGNTIHLINVVIRWVGKHPVDNVNHILNNCPTVWCTSRLQCASRNPWRSQSHIRETRML